MIGYYDMWILASAVKGEDVMSLMCDVNIDERIDKEMLMNWLLRNIGSNPAYFHEVQPFLANHKLWFGIKYKVIKGMLDAEELKYEPLEDYKMKEIIDRDRGIKDITATTTGNTSDTVTSGSETENGSNENKTSAFNEIVYQPKMMDTKGNKIDTNGNQHVVDNGNADVDRKMDEAEDITKTRNGKIGTQSYQSLIKQERELRMWNIYDWILKEYKKDNVYLVS